MTDAENTTASNTGIELAALKQQIVELTRENTKRKEK
jgi:hypothetical protein